MRLPVLSWHSYKILIDIGGSQTASYPFMYQLIILKNIRFPPLQHVDDVN